MLPILPYPSGSGFFSPLGIPGLLLWFDAADASTITVATGVSQWKDKSGYSNHATQAVAANQPALQSAAQNGLNTIGFTSTAPLFFNLTAGVTYPAAFTLAAIVQVPLSTKKLVILGNATTANYPFLSENNIYFTDGSGNELNSQSAVGLASYASVILSAGGSPATDVLDVNGVSTSLGTTTTGVGLSSLIYIGQETSDGFLSDGSIGEIIFYNAALNAAPVASLYQYLKHKWGTP